MQFVFDIKVKLYVIFIGRPTIESNTQENKELFLRMSKELFIFIITWLLYCSDNSGYQTSNQKYVRTRRILKEIRTYYSVTLVIKQVLTAAVSFDATFVIEAFVITRAADAADGRLTTLADSAFVVCAAVYSCSYALNFGFTSKSGGARTLWPVVMDDANSVSTTGRWASTRISALILNAGQMRRTIGVGATPNFAEVMFTNLPVKAFLVTVTLDVATIVNATFV